MIGSLTSTFSIVAAQRGGNELPAAGRVLPQQAASAAQLNSAAKGNRDSSSIEELEIYFAEKLAFLEQGGHDTSNLTALRDAVRSAHTSTAPDRPSLPKVIEHPYGGKTLGNVDLRFGTEIKGELKDLSGVLGPMRQPEALTYSHLHQALTNRESLSAQQLFTQQLSSQPLSSQPLSSQQRHTEQKLPQAGEDGKLGSESKGFSELRLESERKLLAELRGFQYIAPIDVYT